MKYILLLGGNLGDVDATFDKAMHAIAERYPIAKVSSTHTSHAWGYESNNTFKNIVVEVHANTDPFTMLDFLQDVEKRLGRTHKTTDGNYQDRTIDIDILFADDIVLFTPTLTIPHPRLHLRRFTLAPLAERWPELIHPLLHKTAAQLLEQCEDK